MKKRLIKYLTITLLMFCAQAYAKVEVTDSLFFTETTFDFGDVKQGDVVEHVFGFENLDSLPVIIKNVITQCGCTAPEFDKEPIMAGDTGEILIKFDSSNKYGYQRKTIKVKTSSGDSVKLIIFVNIV